MEAYSGFSQVYDELMDDIDYDMWCEYIIKLLKDRGIDNGIVLDLGCGTGNVTQRLSKSGYDMIGVDVSSEMLSVAMDKNTDGKILYLNQDMREFELYGTVAAIVCVCDSLNYITDNEDLKEVFRLANNYLDPNGVFIFDVKTCENFRKIGEKTIAENRDDCSFIWDNYFDEDTSINEYEMTIFVKDDDGKYEKFEETHFQKGYKIKEIKEAVVKSGMKFEACYRAFSNEEGSDSDDRLYFIVREQGKSAE